MTPDQQCCFLTDGVECPNRRPESAPFCEQHQAVFDGVDNPTLIDRAARAAASTFYVREDKKLSAKVDRALIDEFLNSLYELQGRGYEQYEALDAIGDIMQEKGLMDPFLKEMGKDPKWKRFEKIVAGIHMLKAQGDIVKFNDKIRSKKTGRFRQVDVSIRFRQGLYDYLTIVECRDANRKVEETEVEAFSKKLEALGAHRGVMVARSGFQKGTVGTAKFENIDLFTLAEIKSDWAKKLKAHVVVVPFPAHVEFDNPNIDGLPLPEDGQEVNFADLLIHKDERTPPLPLDLILRLMSESVMLRNLPLPCNTHAKFDPPAFCQFPGTTFYTPVYAIHVRMEPHRLGVGYEIDLPPKLQKYVYSDVHQGKTYEFNVDDLPKVD